MTYLNEKYPGIGFAGIILGIFLFLVFAPFVVAGAWGIEFCQLCLTLILLSTLYVVGGRWSHIAIGLCFAIPFLTMNSISIIKHQPHLMAIAYVFYCMFLTFALLLLGRFVMLKRHIDTNLIFAVMTIYILSGLLWAKLYFLQEFMFPGSFSGIPMRETAANLKEAVEGQFDLIYFSFETLTTLGLGDIAPKHHLARSLAVSEAVFGQLFVAIVIAKMVSLWRHDRQES